MARFKLTHGTHQDVDGKIYRAGTKDDVVESDRNLLEDFPNKFELLGDPEELHDLKKRRPTGAAKVRRGSGGPRVNVGRTTERAPAKTRGKGKAVRKDAGKARKATAADQAQDEEEGEDVTADFPEAVDRDLVITKGADNRYTVKNADGSPLTDAPVSKTGVNKLLKETGEDE